MANDVLLEQQLAETQLPPELQDWLDRFVGSVKVSLEFDSTHCCDMDGDYYGNDR